MVRVVDEGSTEFGHHVIDSADIHDHPPLLGVFRRSGYHSGLWTCRSLVAYKFFFCIQAALEYVLKCLDEASLVFFHLATFSCVP